MPPKPQSTFRDKLQPAPQKKLLALDGGGIRGVLTLEVLLRIEELIREKLGENAVLADYFDYIAGTSTGAIIAACLSLGMPVGKVKEFYLGSGPAMFKRAGIFQRFHYKFVHHRLAAQLKEVFGSDTTLGSERLRTLLMMVMRNANTDSPWPVSNNPHACFNDLTQEHCNLHLPLWQLVRASTAAPTFFPPEQVKVGAATFLFEDGGVTMYNNPAFQLFLMSTVEPYNLRWPTGVDRMLLVSVGTGASANVNANLRPRGMNLLSNANSIPSALIYAALNEQDFLCRVFGECLAGGQLDLEVGDMQRMSGPASPKLFTYLRYNTELSREALGKLGVTNVNPRAVQKLDSVRHIGELQQVGRAVAETVRREHFAGF